MLNKGTNQKYTLYGSIYKKCPDRQILRDPEQISGCRHQGEGRGDWEMMAKGFGVSFRGDENPKIDCGDDCPTL